MLILHSPGTRIEKPVHLTNSTSIATASSDHVSELGGYYLEVSVKEGSTVESLVFQDPKQYYMLYTLDYITQIFYFTSWGVMYVAQ